MVVFDPRRTETAKVADEHHFLRPGSDPWVLLAMVRQLFVDGVAAAPSYALGLGAVEEAVASFTPELAEQHSGVPAAEIIRVARDLAAADGGVAYGRIGVSTAEFGSVCQWAINLLNVLSGNLDREGGAMFTSPAIDVVGTGLVGRGGHARRHSRVRGLPETASELPVAVLREEIETPGKGQIRAMLTLSGNPVLSTPDGGSLDRALEGLEFMAAVDIYINETTRHADVILPPTTALERDHYDLIFHVLAVRNTARFTPAVFPKERGARHDWEIYRDIALRTTDRLRPRRSFVDRIKLRVRMSISPTRMIQVLLARGSGTTITAAAPQARGHRPRAAPGGPATRPAAHPRSDPRPGTCPRARGPPPPRRGPAAGGRRARADRPPAQAGLQLLDAQQRAAHEGPAAPPAARCIPTILPLATSSTARPSP